MYALRKRSIHAGHCVLVVESLGRKHTKHGNENILRGYMCAGAEWGEVIHRERDLVWVSPVVWITMLLLTGWRYRKQPR